MYISRQKRTGKNAAELSTAVLNQIKTEILFKNKSNNVSEISVRSNEDISRIFLRWSMEIKPDILVMADALERSYGDIEWKGIKAERDLPWYVLCSKANKTDCFGVKLPLLQYVSGGWTKEGYHFILI